MDWELIVAVTVTFGLTAIAVGVTYRLLRGGRSEKRRVGYQREEIKIDPAKVPEFKPSWRNLR